MPFPTQFVTLGPSTTANVVSGGTAAPTASVSSNLGVSTATDFGSIANRWAAQIVFSQAIKPPRSIIYYTSCDGVNFTQVPSDTTAAGSAWYQFNTPARYVAIQVNGNTGQIQINTVALSD